MIKSSYTPRTCIYRISKEAAKKIYSSRKPGDKDIPMQKYLLNYVNNECGLLWDCTYVEFM